MLIGRLIPGFAVWSRCGRGRGYALLGRFVLLTTIGSAVWNLLLIGSGWLLGTQYHVIEEHIDTANNIIYAHRSIHRGIHHASTQPRSPSLFHSERRP